MNNKFLTAILFAAFFVLTSGSHAQVVVNEFQPRTIVDLSYKPIKKLKISLSPELRFNNDFSIDKYLIEGEVEYKFYKPFSLSARYGLVGNLRTVKSTEYFGRYAFSAKFEKSFKRFDPSLKIMYSNYADDGVQDKNFLRYKAKLKYNIPHFKVNPFVSYQLFQDLNAGGIYKSRYAVGAEYKLFKKNYIGVNYKFDYYNKEYLNRHILSLNYKIKF